MRKFKIGDKVKITRPGASYSTSHRPKDHSYPTMELAVKYPNQVCYDDHYTTNSNQVVECYKNTFSIKNNMIGTVIANDTERGAADGGNVYLVEIDGNGVFMGEDGMELVAIKLTTLDKLKQLKNKLTWVNTDKSEQLQASIEYVTSLIVLLQKNEISGLTEHEIDLLNTINKRFNDN